MKRRLSPVASVAAIVALHWVPAYACQDGDADHEPVAIWKIDILAGAQSSSTLGSSSALAPASLSVSSAAAITDPAILNWKLATGAKAHSTDSTINGYVSNITADVDSVAYD